MEKYADATTVCPFYLDEETLKLHCEGFTKGTQIHLCFDSKERKREHKKKYCHGLNCYEQCPLNSVIMAQYEEEEEEDE